MIKIRWVKPASWIGKDKVISPEKATEIVMRHTESIGEYNRFIGKLGKLGYIHYQGRKVDYLIWDDSACAPCANCKGPLVPDKKPIIIIGGKKICPLCEAQAKRDIVRLGRT